MNQGAVTARPDVVVEGMAQARVMPDRVRIRTVVKANAETSDEAYAAAAVLATKADEVIERFSDDIDRVVAASVTVNPTTRYHKGEQKPTGWRASRHTDLEITRHQRLGQLIGALADAQVEVYGFEWVVDQTNPAIGELRRAATAEARTRATDFAVGLGREVGEVLWIAEPGLGRRGEMNSYRSDGMRGVQIGPEKTRGGEPQIEVEPEEIEVRVSVDVGFELR